MSTSQLMKANNVSGLAGFTEQERYVARLKHSVEKQMRVYENFKDKVVVPSYFQSVKNMEESMSKLEESEKSRRERHLVSNLRTHLPAAQLRNRNAVRNHEMYQGLNRSVLF